MQPGTVWYVPDVDVGLREAFACAQQEGSRWWCLAAASAGALDYSPEGLQLLDLERPEAPNRSTGQPERCGAKHSRFPNSLSPNLRSVLCVFGEYRQQAEATTWSGADPVLGLGTLVEPNPFLWRPVAGGGADEM